uniref:Uncharacterized protein n=1 Tax=Anguilla anguilla TaxID=7936 RepID=A0A0E9TJ41_ANGAN
MLIVSFSREFKGQFKTKCNKSNNSLSNNAFAIYLKNHVVALKLINRPTS